jgi:hypothetical protein
VQALFARSLAPVPVARGRLALQHEVFSVELVKASQDDGRGARLHFLDRPTRTCSSVIAGCCRQRTSPVCRKQLRWRTRMLRRNFRRAASYSRSVTVKDSDLPGPLKCMRCAGRRIVSPKGDFNIQSRPRAFRITEPGCSPTILHVPSGQRIPIRHPSASLSSIESRLKTPLPRRRQPVWHR